MPQRTLTHEEWNQVNDLSDELMIVMIYKQASSSVGVVALAFLTAKALLTLSNNDKPKHTPL